ncbi:MAG: hypothetical protein AAGE65_00340 [Planctomycetota bacterium]
MTRAHQVFLCSCLSSTLAVAGPAWAQVTSIQRVIGETDVLEGFDINVIGGLAGTTDGAVAVRATDTSFLQTFPFPANGSMRLGIVVESPAAPLPITPEVQIQAFDLIPTNAASPLSGLNIADDRTLAYRDTVASGDPLLIQPTGGSPSVVLREGDALPGELGLPGYTWDGFGLVRLVDQDTFLVSASYTNGQTDTFPPQNITGTRFDQGLFRYDAGTWSSVIRTGDSISGLSGAEATVPFESLGLSTFQSLGSLNASTDGNQWIGLLDMDPTAFRVNVNTQPIDDQLLVNGAAVTALPTGGLVREDVAVPAELIGGDAGYDWYDFTNPAINQNGDWIVAGEITNGNGFETLILSGSGSVVDEVLLRTGDAVDSDFEGTTPTFTGRTGDLALNNDGDVAILWGDSLIVNGQEVAAVGSPILDEAGDPAGNLGILTTSVLTLSDRNENDEVVLHFYGRLPGELNTQSDVYRLVLPLTVAGLEGDYNDSGSVEQGDLNFVLNNWGLARGDWANADGFETLNVDQEELNRVLNNWGNSLAAPDLSGSAVPEPTAAAVWGLSGFLLTRRNSCGRPLRRS